MRFVLLLALASTFACSPPCQELTPYQGAFRCPAGAVANAPVTVTPADQRFNALDGPISRCTVALDGGVVTLALEQSVCSGAPPPGFSSVDVCTVPPLPPGRWRIAGFDLDLPADGGTAVGCP
jgi:hypothetical protein